MKGNKIIATLVVLTMLLSTLVVLRQLNVIKEASAQPGVDEWGDATTELVYGEAYSSVTVNSSLWSGSGPFYLYYPDYLNTGAGPNADTFSWLGPFKVGGVSASVTTKEDSAALNPTGVSITFNRSGIWIFDADSSHDPLDPATYAGYIWVNTSTEYTINSISDFRYGSSGSLTVTVNTGDDTGCMISILDPDNNTIYSKWRATGVSDAIGIDTTNFSIAGDYTVKAYRDFDGEDIYLYPDEGGASYGPDYGQGISATDYSWADVGPWDPPEKNASDITFSVLTGKPNIVLTNTTLYWGLEARIDINVTDSDGNGLDELTNPIILKYGSTYVDFAAHISNDGLGNYSITLPRITGWTDLATALGKSNVNGTWKVIFGYDANDDGTYEWNNSASFIVKSSSPPVQLNIVTPSNKEIDVPEYTPGDGYAPTTTIAFDILGTSITGDRAYYGDNDWEDYKNITISGDILYPVDADYSGSNGRWTADVTPTKPGGAITVAIDWPGDDNGSASQTIEIINGTNVVSSVDSFTVGQDYNLTVTVTDMDGAPVKNAYVYLMWEDNHDEFNDTHGTNKAGNGYNGDYTFWIRADEEPATAPQNITIAAEWYTGFWGYVRVIMARNHDMKVEVTPTTAFAGDSTPYDITVSLVDGGNPAKSGLTIALYNETGVLVGGDDAWSATGAYSLTDEELIISGGTYYLYAYNDTHDSEGNNATIVITNYSVAASPSVLAWKIDTETNMTFQMTPAGNGTLTIYNMSGVPEASDEGSSTQVAIENGIGTINEVNATTLGNVTFGYTPDGGQERPADGLLRVTTATATPVPATIYIGEATQVTITITHPATGTPIPDVEVGLDLNKTIDQTVLSKKPANLTTNAQGQVTFALTSEASGNITIWIENASDPDNTFVIVSAARAEMTITTDPSVDEGKTFTITAKDANGKLITGTTVTFTFDGQTWPTTTGSATLTAPQVTTSLTYPITATADGYTSPSTTIMVINIPKLMIIPASGVSGTQKFTITIANQDNGVGVAGAAVSFNGNTYYSGANGICELTAPDVKDSAGQDFTISASFTGFADATPVTQHIAQTKGVPGFELLTLVAAIGVAFLLLRRRQK
jgi:hypothetical protein